VDRHHLRLFVRGELAPDTVRLVEGLVALFRPWPTALDEVALTMTSSLQGVPL
jgi:hypothetical protein